MISKKLKNKVLSILLTAAVAVTSVPSMPVMAAMPENEEEAYVSEVEPASDDLEQTDSEEVLLENEEEATEGLLPAGDEETTKETVTVPEEDVETPQVEEDEKDVVQDEQLPQAEEAAQNVETADVSESVNVDVKAVGSNGVQYSDVAYLSVQAYNNLSEENQKLYTEICDTVAEWKNSGEGYEDIVIYIDENGELGWQVSVPMINLYTSAEEFSVVDGVTEEVNDEAANTKKDAEEPTEPEDENTGDENAQAADDTDKDDKEGEEDTDGSIDGENNDGDAADDNEEQPVSPDADSDYADKKDTDSNADSDVEDTDSKTESKEAEEGDVSTEEEIGEAEESSSVEMIVEEISGIISENTELVIEGNNIVSYNADIPVAEVNTYPANDNYNYFKNQLDSFGKKLYEYNEEVYITKKNQNKEIDGEPGYYVGYELTTNLIVSDKSFANSAVNSISALINMYPNSFNWMDLGEYGSIIRAQMSGRNKVYTIAIPRSKYYTTSLETQADEQVNKLLNAAVTYATNYYPSNPTYGIIEYFDKWICENNYYNYVGTYEDAVSKASREYYYCHSAYGILSNGYGVCESYALAMSRLLDAAQIRNQYVVGDTPGGGHAWNYVQMPDNKWYLLDSTWNDDGDSSNKLFLLISDDGDHKPTGKRFKGGKSFKFETRSKTNYAPASGDLIILKPKAKYNLAVKDSFYTKMVTGWSSSDESIVKVSADGQLTAGKNIGHTDIKMKLSSGEYPIKVYVNNYKVTSITNSNGKTSYDATWTTDYKPLGYAYPITFNVKQNGTDYSLTAEKLQKSASSSVAATTSNKKVVELYGAPAVTGNQIKLYVVPVKIGKSKITVKYGGKSASYTINVKKPIDESLFKFDINSDGYTYTGKAIKPKVTKASSLPGAYKDLKYKVTYKNNKDVGTASVIITGSGNYGGTVTKTFVIKPTTLTGDVQFVSCTESKVYNGARQEPKTKVKVGNKTLKQGSDYILQYKDSEGYTSTLKPKNVGTYTVSIKIKNYDISEETVTAAGTKTFEIKPTTIDKVKVTIPSLKYTSFDLIPGYNQDMVVKIGKNVLPSTDYTVEFKNSSGTEIVSNITDKGTYKIVITPTGSNVTAGKKTAIEKVIKIK